MNSFPDRDVSWKLFEMSGDEVVVRIAVPEDSRAIAFVLAQAFLEYKPLYTEKGFQATTPTAREIDMRFGIDLILVAEKAGDVVGTVSAVLEEQSIYIRSMAILPNARGLHIGRNLLDRIEKLAIERNLQRLRLSTTPFLARAIRLYENFGFTRVGVEDLHGTPLISMEKTL